MKGPSFMIVAISSMLICACIPCAESVRNQRSDRELLAHNLRSRNMMLAHISAKVSQNSSVISQPHGAPASEKQGDRNESERTLPSPEHAEKSGKHARSSHSQSYNHSLVSLETTQGSSRWTPFSPFVSGANLQDAFTRHFERTTPYERAEGKARDDGYPRPYGHLVRGNTVLGDILAPRPGEKLPVLMALGGGTGASIGVSGSSSVDRDLLRRMHYQDKAVMILVLLVYMVALGFSANLTYRQASNNSPVTYYADPRFHNLVMEGEELEVFLDTFNHAPKNIALRVAGFVPVVDETPASLRWRGENMQVAFTFSLDLSPWVVRETHTTTSAGPTQQRRSLHDGALPEDRSAVHYFLRHDKNDLSYVEITKEVSWPDWEELATNIKHQIRKSGFTGLISVDRVETDALQVYKNKPWANFMHARATRVLCALSIIGWLFYVPYMWLRCKKVNMSSHHRVDVSISDYWPLIADKLSADGFQENRPEPTPASH